MIGCLTPSPDIWIPGNYYFKSEIAIVLAKGLDLLTMPSFEIDGAGITVMEILKEPALQLL